MRVSRYPIVFGSESLDLGGFVEEIAPQAVDRTLRGTSDIVALVNHDSNMPLGRRATNTLQLEKTARGLLATVDVNEAVSFGADFLHLIRRHDAPGGSFGFRCLDDIWTMGDGMPHRLVVDMALREISLGVTFPAYVETQRDLDEAVRQAPRHLSMAMRQRLVKQWRLA